MITFSQPAFSMLPILQITLPIASWQWGKNGNKDRLYFLGLLRESIPRQVDRKSGVPEEERGV